MDFREIVHFLATGERLPEPTLDEVREILLTHLGELHRFYGELMGVRIARKHVGWYLKTLANSESFRKTFFQIESAEVQNASVHEWFERRITRGAQAA